MAATVRVGRPQLDGDFTGGVVDLHDRFTLTDVLIKTVTISP